MKRFWLTYVLGGAISGVAGPAVAETLSVPSGQPVTFQDVIWEDAAGKNIYRFRYLAPEIARNGGSVNFSEAEADLLHLCEVSALPALNEQGRKADRIVISLSDRAVRFGTTDSAATQFFDAFHPENDNCIWEGF